MKNLQVASLSLAVATALAACGGGSSDSSEDSSTNNNNTTSQSISTYSLTGTVPGTLIEAYCDDGSYESTHSIQDGTSQHPFTLTLPILVNCRLVMTTNEDDPANKVITPIRLRNVAGSSIAFSNSGSKLNLGHISLAMSRAEMLSDANGDGVEDYPLEVTLSSSDGQVELKLSGADAMDDDGDGIINVYEDTDGDQIPNRDDDDDDNDGIKDIDDYDSDDDGVEDNDRDGDGIKNGDDVDDDNDGIDDDTDRDDDNDGDLDEDDNDDDNDGIDDDLDDDTTSTTGGISPITTEPTAGRLLASQCAQCHGTDGHSLSDIDDLAGEGRGEIIEEMREMHADNDIDIMVFQAKGYTDEQVLLLADYLGNIPGGDDDDEDEDDE